MGRYSKATEGVEVKDKQKEKKNQCKQNHAPHQTVAVGRGHQSNEGSKKKIRQQESSPADNPRIVRYNESA